MSRVDEFRRGWPVLAAGAVGTGTGVSGLALFSAGLFASDLGEEIGLRPATYGLAFMLMTFGMALASPVVGYAVDRFGVKVPAVAGALFLATGFLALGTIVHSVPAFLVAMACLGLFGAGSGPLAYSRVVSSWFDRSRGLALAIATVGGGVAGAVIPLVVSRVIELQGWQFAYLMLACVAVAGSIPSMFLLEVAPPVETAPAAAVPSDDGDDFSTIRKDPLYWRLIFTFALLAAAIAGIPPHLVPMLRNYGMDAGSAAAIASILGISIIIGRLVIGFLIDILPPTVVTAALCLLVACGLLLFAVGGVGFAPVLAFALGGLLGTELDIVGYFTSRYFGLTAFGKAFAGPYMAFIIGGGIAPLCVGAMVGDGNYTPVLYITAALSVLSSIAFLTLPSVEAPRRVVAGPSEATRASSNVPAQN